MSVKELLERIVAYAREVQRGTQPGDAQMCAAHIESLAYTYLQAMDVALPGSEQRFGFPVNPHFPEKCNGCGRWLLMENLYSDDGCPCNTPHGVNFAPQSCATCRTDNCVKPGHRLVDLFGEYAAYSLPGSEQRPEVADAIPAGESAQRTEIVEALTEALVEMGKGVDEAGENPVRDLRDATHMRALARLLTLNEDGEYRDIEYAQRNRKLWARIRRALAAGVPGSALSAEVREVHAILDGAEIRCKVCRRWCANVNTSDAPTDVCEDCAGSAPKDTHPDGRRGHAPWCHYFEGNNCLCNCGASTTSQTSARASVTDPAISGSGPATPASVIEGSAPSDCPRVDRAGIEAVVQAHREKNGPAPEGIQPPLAAAVLELFAACGISGAQLCDVRGDITERDAVELLTFAAKLARKGRSSASSAAVEQVLTPGAVHSVMSPSLAGSAPSPDSVREAAQRVVVPESAKRLLGRISAAEPDSAVDQPMLLSVYESDWYDIERWLSALILAASASRPYTSTYTTAGASPTPQGERKDG